MNINRRQFIKTLLIGSVAAVVAPEVLLAAKNLPKPLLPGEAGFGFVPWKTYTKAAVLNEDWTTRVEHKTYGKHMTFSSEANMKDYITGIRR